MDKEKIKNELVLPNLKQGEKLVGYFQAQYLPSHWWLLLIGPLWGLCIRFYVIAVTNQGLHLHKFNLLGKPDIYNFFPSAEITSLYLGGGVMQAPLQLSFANGRKLRLKAQLKGVDKIAKLDDTTREFLLSHSG
jgi:hypothetical protein